MKKCGQVKVFTKNFTKFSKNKKTNSIQLVVEKFDMQARLDYENYDFDFDKEWKKILDIKWLKKRNKP